MAKYSMVQCIDILCNVMPFNTLRVCVYTDLHVYKRERVRIYIYIDMYMRMYVYFYTYLTFFTYILIYIFVCIYVCMYICILVYLYIRIYVSVYISIHVYMYIWLRPGEPAAPPNGIPQALSFSVESFGGLFEAFPNAALCPGTGV